MKVLRTLFIGLLLPAIAAAEPAAKVFSSGNRQVTLVELYTSEGCSSCPPADRWLSGLKDNRGLWKTFVPVAFHVDYWDYIGWPDRFAAAAHGDRQRRYADEAGLSIVYTPGMLQNGTEWRGWYRGENASLPGDEPGDLTLEVTPARVSGSFQPATKTRSDLVFHVALLGMDLRSQVSAGENRGRELTHDFVVLSTHRIELGAREGGYSGDLDLDTAGAQAIAAWVSTSERQAPIQAVGGFLSR